MCNESDENSEHVLKTCSKVRGIWQYINNVWNRRFTPMDMSWNNMSKGYDEDCELLINYVLNIVIVESKWQIWKFRNKVKYDQFCAENICKDALQCIKYSLNNIARSLEYTKQDTRKDVGKLMYELSQLW